jgi:hypothetical protein
MHTGNVTWGLSNAMAGLMDLHECGHEDRADYIAQLFNARDMAFLKRDLHWNKHYSETAGELKGLANNYFPVMSWIALGRHRLGWDDRRLLDEFVARSLDLFRAQSSNGWFDDSGHGTYDVYHTVATYELAELLRACDSSLVSEMRGPCELLAEEYLHMGQPDGSGFPFGRTIGVNGDMWMASGLLLVMHLGFGERDRYPYYYSLALAAVRKCMEFWYDSSRHISNKWFAGRKTDPYMSKHRILDATLDLYLRLAQAHDLLKGLEIETGEWGLPSIDRRGKLFIHSGAGDCAKATFVYKADEMGFSFPLVVYTRPNGKIVYSTNYLPNIRSNGLFETPIYEYQPFLNPRITLGDDTSFMPYGDYRDLQLERIGNGYVLSYVQREFVLHETGTTCRLFAYRCIWLIHDTHFVRVDLWVPADDVEIRRYEFEYATFGAVENTGRGVFLCKLGDRHTGLGLLESNLQLAAGIEDVAANPHYRCYSGQCRSVVRLVGPKQRVEKGHLYFCVTRLSVGRELADFTETEWRLEKDFDARFEGYGLHFDEACKLTVLNAGKES